MVGIIGTEVSMSDIEWVEMEGDKVGGLDMDEYAYEC
jgi:hypothetical protein